METGEASSGGDGAVDGGGGGGDVEGGAGAGGAEMAVSGADGREGVVPGDATGAVMGRVKRDEEAEAHRTWDRTYEALVKKIAAEIAAVDTATGCAAERAGVLRTLTDALNAAHAVVWVLSPMGHGRVARRGVH